MAEAKRLKPPSPEQFTQELLSSVPSLKDAKARLAALLREYVDQHAILQADWESSQRKPDLEDLVAPPPDLENMEEMLHQWHSAALEDMLRLDAAEPPASLKLHWDDLYQEVISSGNAFGGTANSATEFAFARLLQRQGQMRVQRLALHAIHQEGASKERIYQKMRNSGSMSSPAQRALTAIDSELEFGTQRLRRLRDHLSGKEDCLQSMTSPRDAASFMSSSAWRGTGTVLVRQMLLEEVAAKDLRHFLLQLQYLGFASRAKIWRKSLEHRAVMEIACEGSSGGRHRVLPATLAPLLSVPLGPTNRKRLERTLQEMAQGFSLGHTSMQPDRGKTFAHQAALSFSDLFDKQQHKWQFCAYPIQSCIGVNDHSSVKEGFFLRPSPWADSMPWQAHLDEELEEQQMLLDASYARRSSPLRIAALNHSLSTAHRSKPTYARQLLDQAADLLGSGPTLKGIVEVPGGGCASVDSLLGYELRTLQLADSTLAARRCNEKAEEPVGGPGAAEFAAANQGQGSNEKMPQHLLRAYYLLQYLQSRSCRWRLLAVLNFFRFVHRRLLAAGAVVLSELDEGRGSSFIGRESDPSQRVEEKAQDKYWDISSRGLSRILRHCSVPLTDDAPNASGDFDPLKLDKETYMGHEEETFIIKDSSGRQVLHEAALKDLDCLELEMLKIGSYFINKYEATRSDEREIAAVDRCAVLYDLFASEVWFNTEKQHLVEVYLNIFEDTTEPNERRMLAQRIVDVIASRPRLDLQEPYFVEAYSASILLFRSRSTLLKELQQHQVSCEVSASKRAMSKTGESRAFGRSVGSSGGFNPSATSGSSGARSAQGIPLLPGLDSGLAHPQEGSTLSGGIATAPREGEIMCDGDKLLRHNSCGLVWKAELILESVHKDLARHFQTPPVASTQLERACYVVAMEKWSQQQEPGFFQELPPQEDPELHLVLLQELAKRLLGIEQQERQRWRAGPTFAGEESGKTVLSTPPTSKYNSWVESISMNDLLTHAFEEIATEAAEPSLTLQASYQHVVGCLLAQLLEYLELRSRLLDTAVEVQHLQSVLKEQALDFGSSLMPLKNISGEDANALRGNQLTAALVTKNMGSLGPVTSDALLMQCSKQKIHEVRQLLQHELAFRCLALACVQQNALLLDPQVRSKELTDISTIGLSRDTVASDGGMGVIRRLRDSLEISGHDKNHPHAKQQPEQDLLTVSHNSASEMSKGSNAGEDKQGAAIMDMSRYAQYLQQPARYLEPVISVLSKTWAETDSLREQRFLRFKLLRCSALIALRAGCDLVVGLQVAHTSNDLARMGMLLPKSLTPFTYGDRVKPLVERDGQVTNIFSLPNTFDSLQLRTLPPRELGPLAAQLVERTIEETEERTFEEQVKELLDFNLNGPAIVALQLLNSVASLFALRYAICMLEAEPVCLLEAQRQSRSPALDLDQLFRAHARSVQERTGEAFDATSKSLAANTPEEDINTGDLSRAGPAYEAMEDLCADIARLVARLHALGQENGRKASKVLEVLQTEICSAQRLLAALLRRSTKALQERGESSQAYALRQWSSVVEEATASGDAPRPWFLDLSQPPLRGESSQAYALHQWSSVVEEATASGDAPRPWFLDLPRRGESSQAYALRQWSSLEVPTIDFSLDPRPWFLDLSRPPFAPGARPGARPGQPGRPRLVWEMSALQSSRLLRLPLSLSSQRRHQLSRARSELAERCQALYWIYGLEQHSNQAVYAEAEMFGLMLLRDRLQEVLAAGHLGWSKLPSDAESLALLDAELAATIPPEEPAEPVEISGALELTPAAVRTEMAAVRKKLLALVPACAQLIWSMASEKLSEEFSALVALQFRVQSVASSTTQTPSAAVPDIVPGTSRKNEDVALLTGGPFAAKLDGLQRVAELLTKSTFVRMGNDPAGEVAHVLKELQINACLEDLVFGLWSWGRLMSKNRERRTQEILGFLDHLQNVQKFRSAVVEAQTIEEGHVLVRTAELDWLEASKESMKEKRESMEAQFRADVAARAVKMVFEVDRVHRCQRNLKAAAAELQSRLEDEVIDQVRSTISNFHGALSAEDGRFRESHGISGEVLQRQLRDLREHVTSELSGLAAKNQAVQFKAVQPRQVTGLETLLPEKDTGGIDFQTLVGGLEAVTPESDDGKRTPMKRRRSQSNTARRTSEVNVKPSVLTVSDGMYGKLADVAARREVYDLQMELKTLRDRQLLERIFHKFKCEAMRQHFKRKVQEQEATLQSNSQLLGHFAEISRAEDAAASEFIRGAQEVSDAEKRTEELGPLTHSNAEQKRRLAKWKKNKSKQLYHMKKGVRDHEMAGTMDVASLLQDIQSKQELVKLLQQSQREFDEEVVRASEESAAETAHVRAAMMKQREVKDDTFKELQRLRAEMQRPDGAKNVEYWRLKVMEIRQEMKSLEEENAKLRMLLSMKEQPKED